MTINIFVLKGDFNGENCSGAFLFLSSIFIKVHIPTKIVKFNLNVFEKKQFSPHVKL